jgi:hypothetical protein
MSHEGSCHCGRIAFEVEGEVRQLMECNCSICSRKGYLLWFVPRASLKLRTREDDWATYTFNRHVIRHVFCPTCGCSPFGLGTDPQGNASAAINARCLTSLDRSGIAVEHFDGRKL